MATPTALVIGSNGQDGSYLAEVLLERGYGVTGVARQAQSRFVSASGFLHLAVDLRDDEALRKTLEVVAPDRIFYLAAVHGPPGFRYEDSWRDALEVNVAGLPACLEPPRRRARGA